MHSIVEKYLNNEDTTDFLPHIRQSLENLKPVLDESIGTIFGLEVPLFSHHLGVAGRCDCIAQFNGVPSIIDFKTAKRIKRREWIEDYFLQGCAYANAHNVMFSTNIKQVVILMIDRDLIFKEFTVNGHEFDFFTNKWKQKIIQFNRNV